MKIVKAGVLYFAAVFGAGFAFGTVRVLLVVPHVGARMAELMEAPLMLLVTFFSARWVVRRLDVPPVALKRLGVGFVALGLMLVSEFSLVLWLRGMTIGQYIAGRDPVSGTVYYLMLGMFAVMPLLTSRG